MFQLTKVEGPACPRCGCPDSEVVANGSRYERRRCNHCGDRFDVNVESPDEPTPGSTGDAVRYDPIHCPTCNSKNVRVTSTQKPVRYHKCQDCGHPFKSVEH